MVRGLIGGLMSGGVVVGLGLGAGLIGSQLHLVKKADAAFIGIEHLTDKELAAILREVERRGRDIHAGQPARAVRSRPASRAEA